MDKKTENLLKKVGYFKIREKRRKPLENKFPDLSTGNHQEKYPSGKCFAKTPGKKELPPDAIQFPVGHAHKSGLQLITNFDELKYMTGKKF